MNPLIAVILGASVSSGYSGKPVAELVAEGLGIPFRNEASICHKVEPNEVAGRKGVLWFNLDGKYWRSYDKDCAAAAASVRGFYEATAGQPKVMATVPARNAGGFYRFVCGAETREQLCRPAINAALREGCDPAECVLVDADELYDAHKDVDDIHLTPDIWRAQAKPLLEKVRALNFSTPSHSNSQLTR